VQHIESLILIKTPQAILFDLDGVLVDACDWHYEALNKALIDMGHNHINKEEHISKYNGLPTRVKLNMLGINESQAHKINNLKQKHTLDIIKNKCKIMPEKIQLHNFLKQNNIKIATLTQLRLADIEYILKYRRVHNREEFNAYFY
jgi:beta-phosphoglucomutase-like phosphatase (HAD superfamily)